MSRSVVFNVVDEVGVAVCKMKFLSEAIASWDENGATLNTEYRSGFGYLMDDVLKDIEKNMDELGKTIKKGENDDK